MNNINHLKRNSNTIINQSNGLQGFNGINTNIINVNGMSNMNGFFGTMNTNNFNGNTLPKANTNAPFRNLFGDDGTIQSPQFKNI